MAYRLKLNNLTVFIALWLILFALYLPAARAGFVMDFTGWLYNITHDSFYDYITMKHWHMKSLYQFWMLTVYVFYKVFGANPWAWHILFITMQALVGLLLFVFSEGLFRDTGLKNPQIIAGGGVLLFSICPHISEVVVWEPTFHYQQATSLLLLILIMVQAYLRRQKSKYILCAILLYTLSLFSLEYFYLTPLFVLALGIFYRLALNHDKKKIRHLFTYTVIPFIVLCIARNFLFRLVYHNWVSRLGDSAISTAIARPDLNTLILKFLAKPLEFIFHIVLLGRYYPETIRRNVYAACESLTGIITFYVLVCIIGLRFILRFKKFEKRTQLAIILFAFAALAVTIVIPMHFPQIQLIAYDRYTYLITAFTYMLIALSLSYIPRRQVGLIIFAVIALINIRYTIKINRYWKQCAHVDNELLDTFPGSSNKITILLDQPENMHGAPMVQATHQGEFKLMYNLLKTDSLTGIIMDAVSFNMETPEDGAHIMVINDSMLHVTANQWGTWWWFDGLNATDRENEYFKIHIMDGHWYELTLRKPPSQYRLLYQTGGTWKQVDWSKLGQDQY